LLLLCAAASARAEEAGVSAALSSDTIALDETVQLTVAITRDASQAYQSYLRPDLKDFDILHQGQAESTQWTITNGHQAVHTVEQHIYLLRPRKKGACAIPAATARIGGKDYKSRELTVHVNPPTRKLANQPQAPIPDAQNVPEPGEMRGDEELFLDVKSDKPTLYVGEQLLVTWSLYTRTDILRYRAVTEPKHDEFWSEDIFTPPNALSWGRMMVHGQDYQAALLMKKALFPLKAGKLTITPLEAEVTTLQTAFYAGASAVRASKPVTVEVLPLPAAGRPDGFEPSNVGRFELSSQLDKTEVKAGDAVTYKLIVRGQGNIRNVKLKKIDRLAGFKVYEPTLNEHVDRGEITMGDKIFTYLLLPQSGGELTIPAVELPYFDPGEKKYAIARAPSQTVKVIGDPQKIGSGPADSKENVLSARVRPIRISNHVGSRLGERIVRGKLLWVSLAAPPSLLFLIVGIGALRARLQLETARSRRRRARAGARRRMREAEIHMKGQRPSAFFGACARAIYEHLEYRLEVKCEALTVEELRRLLGSRGFDNEVCEEIVRELESCDFARFAPSASGPGEMRAATRRVRGLLTSIERARVTQVAA
jgi:hypothetical protein